MSVNILTFIYLGTLHFLVSLELSYNTYYIPLMLHPRRIAETS
jgi:hypothetical protein